MRRRTMVGMKVEVFRGPKPIFKAASRIVDEIARILKKQTHKWEERGEKEAKGAKTEAQREKKGS